MPFGQALSIAVSAILSITGLVFLWSALFGAEGMRVHQQMNQKLEGLQQKLADSEAKNDHLEKIIEDLRNSEQAQKDEVRDGLGYLERNEVILVPGSAK